MRAFRICGCWLLLGTLLGILGCGSSSSAKKGAEVKSNMVTIKGCKADPDTVQVFRNDTLTWTIDASDSHTYSIQFPKSKPFSSSTVPPGQGQKVTGDFWCNTLGGISTSLCVYPYNLIQDGSTTCADPGVHVVPGP